MTYDFATIKTRLDAGVLFAAFDNPPINLIGPELVRDLISLLDALEHDAEVNVVVFASADKEFFLPHVDIARVAEYTKEAARIPGSVSGSLGGLLRRISEMRQVTIAQIEGVARGAGSEFALACDMRFASKERAVFGQIEAGIGAVPGAGAIQHLTRLLGRGRAMEVVLSSNDYNAELAERYGWINRAIPQSELEPFVRALAYRIAEFPATGLIANKRRINDVSLAPLADVRTDAALFQQTIREPRAQERTKELLQEGMQTRGQLETEFGAALGRLKS
ncbi:enoyl-CoA hydratase/isomerase family protein [Paraburkholderia sp. BL25I1N1]|uniref:enoyl-CoA hydratase/isomerase family protein n=1 Tax=Paraburkholderia sp. BL25I1N1 TaxID=1938804 RepID=UPI000D082C44|nr:enoyl-CoA hydratase/isomerase family protein [Paraburkholderia sp. BL25I1N1]PRY04442.1 enoyl-CoA hydratase/carnithine racemase [Paraburkholderia sp. BL25I1N1]